VIGQNLNSLDKKQSNPVIAQYLDLMDTQREQVFSLIAGISHEALWQRPAPKEWCIGEILHHNIMLLESIFPVVRVSWRFFNWTGRLLKSRPYRTTIKDPYRKKLFPHWVGFLWNPKYTPEKPVSFERLIEETRDVHQEIRSFYEDKEVAMLGNVFVFDPLFGFINLIVTLRIGIYHDQLHYEDVVKIVNGEL
jgi:hypothetical protein